MKNALTFVLHLLSTTVKTSEDDHSAEEIPVSQINVLQPTIDLALKAIEATNELDDYQMKYKIYNGVFYDVIVKNTPRQCKDDYYSKISINMNICEKNHHRLTQHLSCEAGTTSGVVKNLPDVNSKGPAATMEICQMIMKMDEKDFHDFFQQCFKYSHNYYFFLRLRDRIMKEYPNSEAASAHIDNKLKKTTVEKLTAWCKKNTAKKDKLHLTYCNGMYIAEIDSCNFEEIKEIFSKLKYGLSEEFSIDELVFDNVDFSGCSRPFEVLNHSVTKYLTRVSFFKCRFIDSKLYNNDIIGGNLNLHDDDIEILKKITYLKVENCGDIIIQGNLKHLESLQIFTVIKHRHTKIPDSICEVNTLKALKFDCGLLEEIPKNISKLANLKELSVSHNKLKSVPIQLKNIEVLILKYNTITEISSEIDQLNNLKVLVMDHNSNLNNIPIACFKLKSIEHLSFMSCNISKLPDDLFPISKSNQLPICEQPQHGNPSSAENVIQDDYKKIIESSNLHMVFLSNNELTGLPSWLFDFPQLEKLALHSNKINNLPDNIGSAKNLRNLDLYLNQMSNLPDSFRGLSKLSDLDLSGNNFTELPDYIGECTNIIKLNASRNNLSKIPQSMLNMNALENLNISNNSITELSKWIEDLKGLKVMNVSCNKITSLEDWVFSFQERVDLILSGNPIPRTVF